MRTLYSWTDVARRTEVVYDHAMNVYDEDLLQRLSRQVINHVGFDDFVILNMLII